jgi:hypothetical protein
MNQSFWNRIKNNSISSKSDIIMPYPSPPSTQTDKPYNCRLLTESHLTSVSDLLYTEFHYAYLSKTPDMVISPRVLLNDISHGAYGIGCWVNNDLIGCVWARPIGIIERNNLESDFKVDIYIVEHLCIATRFRGKGITRVLLNWLEVERPRIDMRFMFLKEGKAVPTNYICWDNYVYARISGKILNKIKKTRNVPNNICKQISLEDALIWRKLISKDPNILWNTPGRASRTQLWLWKDKALMAITETHQIHPLDDQPIGLITGWICSDSLSIMERSEAQIDVFREQPYTWLWSKIYG